MSLNPGNIYVFAPFNYEYNPERNSKPFVGLYLERIREPNWSASQFKVIGPGGIELLWANRWGVDPVPEFVGKNETG